VCGVCVHLHASESERGRELTAMVAVGLKATLIFMISPFDIPPCLANHIFLGGEREREEEENLNNSPYI
jgi:hypothetical protein